MTDNDFTLEQFFGSKTRARLLALFFMHEHEKFYVRELTRRVDAHVHAVRRELANLVSVGVLEEVDAKGVGKSEDDEGGDGDQKKYYALRPSFPLYHELKALMRKLGVLLHGTLGKRLAAIPGSTYIVLCGCCVGREGAQLDVLLVGDCQAEDVRSAVEECEREVGRELNFTHLKTDDFLYRRSVGDRFLGDIFEHEHIVVKNMLDSVTV